jgi:hypothetical protein
MLFFVTGASGSGKTACMPYLRELLPEFYIRDFDEVAAVSGEFAEWQTQPQSWRQRATEYWLQQALQKQAGGTHMIICGAAVLGEILACPSAPQIDKIALCLLDCYDVLRIDRILNRPGGREVANMDSLCWAAWLRMHAVDPQWRQDVIKTGGAPGMFWERWDSWQRGDPRWQTFRLDSTELTLEETARQIAAWIEANLAEVAQK